MTTPATATLLHALNNIRREVDPHFRLDTAAQGFKGTTPSTGHCAAVSVLVHARLGGEFVSAIVDGGSHWFNRFLTPDGTVDVDLTADQFGHRPVETALAGQLYEGTRVRSFSELNAETLHRARLLALRAGMADILDELEKSATRKPVAATR